MRQQGSAPANPMGVMVTRATSHGCAQPFYPQYPPVLGNAWEEAMYSMNNAQLANANTKPRGSPLILTSARSQTPATASRSARILRRVREPRGARMMRPKNSMAPTVPSGTRAMARYKASSSSRARFQERSRSTPRPPNAHERPPRLAPRHERGRGGMRSRATPRTFTELGSRTANAGRGVSGRPRWGEKKRAGNCVPARALTGKGSFTAP